MLLSPGRLCRHLLVCGATGRGKTETLLRLAWTVAKWSDAPGLLSRRQGRSGDRERFFGLMADAGRRRGCSRTSRLTAGAGAARDPRPADGGHRLRQRRTRGVVSRRRQERAAPGLRAPRRAAAVTRSVLARMDLGGLRTAHAGSSALAALTAQQVGQVRLRYEAFFGQTRGALDGELGVGGHAGRLPAARQSRAARGDERAGPLPVRGLRALLHDPQAPRPVRAADRR